jgi:hypothetical protein
MVQYECKFYMSFMSFNFLKSINHKSAIFLYVVYFIVNVLKLLIKTYVIARKVADQTKINRSLSTVSTRQRDKKEFNLTSKTLLAKMINKKLSHLCSRNVMGALNVCSRKFIRFPSRKFRRSSSPCQFYCTKYLCNVVTNKINIR